MAWSSWRSHRHAIAAAIVTHKFCRRERAPRHTLTHANNPQVLVMSVMFVGFVVLLHIYGKLTAVPDAVDEDPIMPETPGADA